MSFFIKSRRKIIRAGRQKSVFHSGRQMSWAAKMLGGKNAGRQKSVYYYGRQKSVYYCGWQKSVGSGRQKSVLLRRQKSVWAWMAKESLQSWMAKEFLEKAAKITFCRRWQKFGRQRSCSHLRYSAQ